MMGRRLFSWVAFCSVFALGLVAEAQCKGEFCRDASIPQPWNDGGNKCEFCKDGGDGLGGGGVAKPCWDPELKRDVCNQPPKQCPPQAAPTFTFIDDQDGKKDGQLFALGNGKPALGCGTIKVNTTGYYKLFDTEISESCATQKDETGYITIANSCNPKGWALEANIGDRFLVLDSDNTPKCQADKECGTGRVCRKGNMGGKCCVPDKPTFMGTFLLVAGEKNTICLHHFCPEWRAEKKKTGKDLGFITAGCSSIDSIHFRLDTNAVVCAEDETVKPCQGGCKQGKCAPDPCDARKCPKFCKDGQCLQKNPCDGLSCQHGCKNGRCLQAPSAPGSDADGDGYKGTADCDDKNAAINPGAAERCSNGLDDDCDGSVDEADCQSPKAGGTPAGGGDSGGCGCRASPGAAGASVLLGILLLLPVVRRRRRPESIP